MGQKPFSSREDGALTLAPILQAVVQRSANRIADSHRKELSWREWNATLGIGNKDAWEKRVADAMMEPGWHLLRLTSPEPEPEPRQAARWSLRIPVFINIPHLKIIGWKIIRLIWEDTTCGLKQHLKDSLTAECPAEFSSSTAGEKLGNDGDGNCSFGALLLRANGYPVTSRTSRRIAELANPLDIKWSLEASSFWDADRKANPERQHMVAREKVRKWKWRYPNLTYW